MFCVPSQEKKVTVALLQGELWEALWEEKRILSDFFFGNAFTLSSTVGNVCGPNSFMKGCMGAEVLCMLLTLH